MSGAVICRIGVDPHRGRRRVFKYLLVWSVTGSLRVWGAASLIQSFATSSKVAPPTSQRAARRRSRSSRDRNPRRSSSSRSPPICRSTAARATSRSRGPSWPLCCCKQRHTSATTAPPRRRKLLDPSLELGQRGIEKSFVEIELDEVDETSSDGPGVGDTETPAIVTELDLPSPSTSEAEDDVKIDSPATVLARTPRARRRRSRPTRRAAETAWLSPAGVRRKRRARFS